MRRRALGAVVTLVLVLMSAFANAPANAETTQPTFLTFYGWWDNTPPGGDISYPQIHSTAGGTGTFADPITFATATAELKAGTKVWVPRVRKYFIMEDGCDECGQDWSGHGPNGGPGLRHIDLWLGGKGGSAMDAIDCEDALTHYNDNGTPVMEPVVVDPPSNENYDPAPIFNTSTGECYGGAQPNKTVGSYKNVSTGMCMEDPNNSSTSGTQMKTAPCTGSAAQEFTFHGAFFVKNNLCLGMSSSKIVLQTCTAGPNQQWSVNPSNKTISDIQTSKKCFREASGAVTAGSCSGAASQWDFTASGGTNDFTVGVSPASGSITGGGSVTSTVNTTGAGSIALSASNVPAGATVTFSPATVTAGGTSTLKVATTADAPAGTFPITVTGTSAGISHTATYTLTVGGSGPGEPVLLSQGQPATASSTESSTYSAAKAFDGDLTKTRWASKEGADPQWVRIDLGGTATVSHVKLTWEAAYGKSYTIQTSPDGSTWTTIYSTTTGNGGTDDLTGLTGTGRYVRMNGTVRGTSYGYSLYEMQVYGTR
ncbi:discoidin domain-containing protein [Actinocrispum wychmicini]|uniref:Ricin-type beta-trefoil lectin protein n=1 Tax=Actinocrispum wychmicini TaxID=1213861 RepID=A0A4R2J939_9PSEU|nr:ricin-type beta-trefoil lectin protein [Actinocrispum wychmicini]